MGTIAAANVLDGVEAENREKVASRKSAQSINRARAMRETVRRVSRGDHSATCGERINVPGGCWSENKTTSSCATFGSWRNSPRRHSLRRAAHCRRIRCV